MSECSRTGVNDREVYEKIQTFLRLSCELSVSLKGDPVRKINYWVLITFDFRISGDFS